MKWPKKIVVQECLNSVYIALGAVSFKERDAFSRELERRWAKCGEIEAEEAKKSTEPKCLGYPKCDGDLVGLDHEKWCPCHPKAKKAKHADAPDFSTQRDTLFPKAKKARRK